MKLAKKVVIISLLLMSIFTFCACKGEKEFLNKMSELRQNYFDIKTADYYVSLTTGYRENPYLSDGKHSGNLTQFGLLELTLFDKLFSGDKLEYEIMIENNKIKGVMEKNPFTSTFMDDIEMVVEDNKSVIIKVLYGEEAELSLVNRSLNFEIDYSKALEIASTNMSEKFKEKNIKFDGETYLKLIHDNSSFDKFFWHFSVKNSDKKTYSLIIDVNNGQIVVWTI